MMPTRWVLEWSCSRNRFRIQPADSMVAVNRRLYEQNKVLGNDFMVLHFGTQDECETLASNCRGTLAHRSVAAKA